MKLFDLSLQLNGFPIRKAETLLKEIEAINDADYEDYIEQKKRGIVAYHLKNNKFYKDFVGNINIEDWANIPVMTKCDLQQPLQNRLSTGFTEKSVYRSKTSGSVGDPFIFAKDKFCHALTWAINKDRFSWYGIDFNTSKQGRFYGIPLSKIGYIKERIKDFFGNRIRFSVFDISDETFKNNVSVFSKTRIDYINGHTNAIVQFGKYLKRENIILKTICPTLKACMVTSEMLFEQDKKLLESQFNVPIIREYGASELDTIAFENQIKEWQITSESLFVEILDNTNLPVKKGEIGRVIITSLYNKAHPFIRYDIGDTASLDVASTFRKPLLKNLVGRTNDIAVLPSGRKVAGTTFYYITKSLIEDDGEVTEFIMEQLKIDTFKISYVGKRFLSEKKTAYIINEVKKYLEHGLIVLFEKKEKLTRTKAGKLKLFISHL